MGTERDLLLHATFPSALDIDTRMLNYTREPLSLILLTSYPTAFLASLALCRLAKRLL